MQRELDELKIRLDAIEAWKANVQAFLIRQFPMYFAGEADLHVDPTANPVVLNFQNNPEELNRRTLQDMHRETQ